MPNFVFAAIFVVCQRFCDLLISPLLHALFRVLNVFNAVTTCDFVEMDEDGEERGGRRRKIFSSNIFTPFLCALDARHRGRASRIRCAAAGDALW